MAARALKLWAKYERKWKRQFLHRIGVLWMAAGRDDAFERGSVEALRDAKIKFAELSTVQMKKCWPQINFEGIQWGIFEPECGYLDAGASCQAVVEAFIAAGGKYQHVSILPTVWRMAFSMASCFPMAPCSRPTSMSLPADHGSAGCFRRQSVI